MRFGGRINVARSLPLRFASSLMAQKTALVTGASRGAVATDITGGLEEKGGRLILREEHGLTPIRRWGQPGDIAGVGRAIAKDRFPYSTGAVIDVDGGYPLHRL